MSRSVPTIRYSDDPPRTSAERHAVAHDLLETAAVTTEAAERQRLFDEVVVLNADVAESVASRYRGRGVATDDLRQVAYEGLVKAVRRFDPERRKDFLSFAVPTIRGEVQRYFRDQGWAVRPPRRIQDLQWQLHRAIEELSQELGRDPSGPELAEELGVTAREISDAGAAYGSFSPVSLDQPVNADGASHLSDLLPDDDADARASEARMVLAPALRKLSDRDRRILYLRYCEDRTQQEIGDDIGVTQMQVSRTLTRILHDLRAELEAA